MLRLSTKIAISVCAHVDEVAYVKLEVIQKVAGKKAVVAFSTENTPGAIFKKPGCGDLSVSDLVLDLKLHGKYRVDAPTTYRAILFTKVGSTTWMQRKVVTFVPTYVRNGVPLAVDDGIIDLLRARFERRVEQFRAWRDG